MHLRRILLQLKQGTRHLAGLGSVNVNFTVNHDDIVLVGQAEYRSLKFKVQDAPVNILNMSVIYQNGKVDQFNLKYQIPAGGESRVIDLKTDNLKDWRKKNKKSYYLVPNR
jgi:hypothetical protein